jgi:anthranilate phosphoribosyltransferase
LPPAPVLGDEIATTVDSNALARAAAEQGLAALKGERGLMYDSLVYVGAIALTHLQRYTNLVEAADAVRASLDSGKALASFQAAR